MDAMVNDEASSSSSTSNHNSTRRVSRVGLRLRNPRMRLGMARRRVRERQAEALALPQGVSIAAAFANLVLERKTAAGLNVCVNDLALIYACAVKESLANVYGHKLGSFATSFERSFNTTLRTLVAINDSAFADNLAKFKGVSKAAFRAEKFRTELEDIKADMFTLIMDWLVVGVFNVLAWTCYGAYIFSRQRIMEGSSICEPSSWWVPQSEFNILICRFRVWVQSCFIVLMTLLLTYLIILRRSSGTKKTTRVPFTVLFLGIVCGLSGKFCVDTIGGNGKLWLFLWGMFWLLQLVVNVFPLALYGLMFGPIDVTHETTKSSTMVPYWARPIFFCGVVMLVLPMINGLLPFATFGEWRDHLYVISMLLKLCTSGFDFRGDSLFGLFFFLLVCISNFLF